MNSTQNLIHRVSSCFQLLFARHESHVQGSPRSKNLHRCGKDFFCKMFDVQRSISGLRNQFVTTQIKVLYVHGAKSSYVLQQESKHQCLIKCAGNFMQKFAPPSGTTFTRRGQIFHPHKKLGSVEIIYKCADGMPMRTLYSSALANFQNKLRI